MALYTFYPYLPDGKALTFETFDLADDVAAEVFAATVMNGHPTCAHVVVWDGLREVCACYREETPSRSSRQGSSDAGTPA